MTLYLSNRDGGKTDEEGHYRWNMNVPVGNVTSGLTVTQNSPLGMSVLVTAGEAKVPYNGYAYGVFQPSGTVSATITTANGSNPRIDRVVLYVDRGATPQTTNPNNPSIPKIAVVAGTPGATPARPSDASVNSAVSNNPWIDLADVLVGTSVTQITNSNITDTRQVIDRGTGWTPAMEAWAYASATTITVPTDATTKYPKGVKIRLVQGGSVKYFYVVGVTSTVLTITGGSDYTLTNAIISAPYFSVAETPAGFPQGFNFTPNWTGFTVSTGGSAYNQGFFSISDGWCKGYTRSTLGTSAPSVGGSVYFAAPVNFSSDYNGSYNYPIGQTWCTDAGTSQYVASLVYQAANTIAPLASNVAGTYSVPAGVNASTPMTWAPNDSLQTEFNYRIV